MTEKTGSKRPRAARIAWLLGLGIPLVAAIVLWITFGTPDLNDRAFKNAADAADVQAHGAVGRLASAARESAPTDDEIKQATRRSIGQVHEIRRPDSGIVVIASFHVATSGAFGTISVDPCYEYDITLPVRNESSIKLQELPSCP
ncbi:hypothetical protein ABJI51_08320 [Amycolatopsis sp. NEAU-NG30]|uniref:Uncharacterized protein n=1 Tax=Amycolatopsis melonis TaxID=3156488 RepID=A0ABV0LCH8_9PSEU